MPNCSATGTITGTTSSSSASDSMKVPSTISMRLISSSRTIGSSEIDRKNCVICWGTCSRAITQPNTLTPAMMMPTAAVVATVPRSTSTLSTRSVGGLPRDRGSGRRLRRTSPVTAVSERSVCGNLATSRKS